MRSYSTSAWESFSDSARSGTAYELQNKNHGPSIPRESKQKARPTLESAPRGEWSDAPESYTLAGDDHLSTGSHARHAAHINLSLRSGVADGGRNPVAVDVEQRDPADGRHQVKQLRENR